MNNIFKPILPYFYIVFAVSSLLGASYFKLQHNRMAREISSLRIELQNERLGNAVEVAMLNSERNQCLFNLEKQNEAINNLKISSEKLQSDLELLRQANNDRVEQIKVVLQKDPSCEQELQLIKQDQHTTLLFLENN